MVWDNAGWAEARWLSLGRRRESKAGWGKANQDVARRAGRDGPKLCRIMHDNGKPTGRREGGARNMDAGSGKTWGHAVRNTSEDERCETFNYPGRLARGDAIPPCHAASHGAPPRHPAPRVNRHIARLATPRLGAPRRRAIPPHLSAPPADVPQRFAAPRGADRAAARSGPPCPAAIYGGRCPPPRPRRTAAVAASHCGPRRLAASQGAPPRPPAPRHSPRPIALCPARSKP